MSAGKKIIALLFLFIILIAYSVYSFDYNTIINKDGNLVEKVDEIKSTVSEYVGDLTGDEKDAKGNFLSKIELEKTNGMVVMNGLFKDEKQSQEIMEKLSINKLGNIQYNKDVKLDEALFDKLASLITPLKDFFSDNSKINIIGSNVDISGELKDKNYKDLLDSIIKRTDLNIKLDVKEPVMSKTEEIIDVIKENNLTSPQEITNNEEIKEILSNDKEIVQNDVKNTENSALSNISSKTKEIQSSINKLLEVKKINFERRSTKVTDESYEVIKEIAKILEENNDIKVEIAGHTDSRGAASLNKKISQDRADSVKQILIDLGIDSNRLKAVGYGEDFPIAKDDADGLSEINRRVEFNIIGE